jgi:AcrR family transcriptional regulator
VRVVDRDGASGVTFDSMSAQAGVTRGGMMYHFPSRAALLQAIHQHLADQWEASLESLAGKPIHNTTPEERTVSYARTELLFLLQSSTSPEFTGPWDGVLQRWTPPAPQTADDPVALSQFIARLVADGLLVYESLSSKPLSPKVRQRVAEQMARVIDPTLEEANLKPRGPRRTTDDSPDLFPLRDSAGREKKPFENALQRSI